MTANGINNQSVLISPKIDLNAPELSDDLLLNEQQTANLLGLTIRCLQAWRCRGRGLPFVRISSRCVRYKLKDIRQWAESKTKNSTCEE